MAKIKVESQSTGTGIYTLKTGTASTNYSATLPDATGTLSTEKLTTKGDLEVYGTAPDRLAVGTNDYLLTADSTAANGVAWKAAAGGGKVLQVLSTSKTDTFTTSSTSYTDITGLSIDITPSATTSNILIIAHISISNGTGSNQSNLDLVRNSTSILLADAAGSRQRTTVSQRFASANEIGVVSINYLDDPTIPATPVPITYKIQALTLSPGPIAINRTGDGADSLARSRATSTITVMEIGA